MITAPAGPVGPFRSHPPPRSHRLPVDNLLDPPRQPIDQLGISLDRIAFDTLRPAGDIRHRLPELSSPRTPQTE